MVSTLHQLHKQIRRWNLQLNKSLGWQVGEKIFMVLGLGIVLSIQLIMYIALSSHTIYCQLPNLRFYYQSCQGPALLYEKLPTIYVITPTYARHVQKAELTRLSHTFMLAPKLHWIIVEDSDNFTDIVTKFVWRLKAEFDFHTITRLHASTPKKFKLKRGEPSWAHPKGVWQRNKGLDWLRDNSAELDKQGVIYFADDDNTYDLELFNEMRYTDKVSVWPVGLAGGLLVEKPIVHSASNKVRSFNSMWEPKRPYPIDMAGFAISMNLFMSHPGAHFSADQKIGYMESHFLNQLVTSWSDLEPKANSCSKVLVWHTKTQRPDLHEERKIKMNASSNRISPALYASSIR